MTLAQINCGGTAEVTKGSFQLHVNFKGDPGGADDALMEELAGKFGGHVYAESHLLALAIEGRSARKKGTASATEQKDAIEALRVQINAVFPEKVGSWASL